jgi:hypothetical protein
VPDILIALADKALYISKNSKCRDCGFGSANADFFKMKMSRLRMYQAFDRQENTTVMKDDFENGESAATKSD